MPGEIELDAHHHLWSLNEGAYRWIKDRLHLPNMPAIDRDFEAPEFRRVLAENGVRRSLLVQTECTAIETEQMLARADVADFVAGVVGWVDIAAADAATEVERRAADPRIKGLRIWLLTRPDTDWIFGDGPARAFAAAHAAALPLELFPGPAQLDATARLIAARGLDRVAICHAGKPGVGLWRADGPEFAAWAEGMRRLAAMGCTVKLSGIVTECGDAWDAETVGPYFEVLMAHFGPARTMWGSDWPVIDRAGGYARWLGAVRNLAEPLSEADRALLFGRAAIAFYGLQ